MTVPQPPLVGVLGCVPPQVRLSSTAENILSVITSGSECSAAGSRYEIQHNHSPAIKHSGCSLPPVYSTTDAQECSLIRLQCPRHQIPAMRPAPGMPKLPELRPAIVSLESLDTKV